MDSEDKFISALLAFVASIALTILGGCYNNEVTYRKAIETGLVQKPIIAPGTTSVTLYWTKP